MQIAVRGKNIDVTNALRDHAEKRLGRLDKYLGPDRSAQVTLSTQRERHIVEVTIPLDGMLLRGEEATNDMYASIDMVVDKLEKQINKYRAKLSRKLPFRVPDMDEDEAPAGAVVRTKRFVMKPMSVEEAILQMNLVGHDFFVFANAEGERVNVVYRRKDGNYGLIEPE